MSGRSRSCKFRRRPVKSEKYIPPLDRLRSGWGAPFALKEPYALTHYRFFWQSTVQ